LDQAALVAKKFPFNQKKGIQSQQGQTILEYGCALGCVPSKATYKEITKSLYCCSYDLCNHALTYIKINYNGIVFSIAFILNKLIFL
jgi:hypothetical protein